MSALINIILLLTSLIVSQTAYADSLTHICLTGKVETFLPNYKTAFLNAANLSLIENPEIHNVNIKTYFFDNKPLSAIRTYDQMMRDHCNAIIGFEYLSDLLLIAKKQRNNNIPIFTSYASSLNADLIPSNIFIFMPSYNYHAQKMLAFLHKKYKVLSNVLIVTEVDDAALIRYKNAYQSLLNQAKIPYNTFDFLGSDEKIESKIQKLTEHKHYHFVFVLASAVSSTKILNTMNDQNIVFIGTEYFGSSINQSVFVRLNNKIVHAYVIRNIDLLKSNQKLKDFKKVYMQHYAVAPNPLAIYTYDAMNIILNSLKKYHFFNTDHILETDYTGVSGAFIKNKKFYRSKQYAILSIEKTGFVYAE